MVYQPDSEEEDMEDMGTPSFSSGHRAIERELREEGAASQEPGPERRFRVCGTGGPSSFWRKAARRP